MTTARFKKRLGEPVPYEAIGALPGGIAGALALVSAVPMLWAFRAGGVLWALCPAVVFFGLLGVSFYAFELWLRRQSLLRDAQVRWPGRRALVITSDSPRWSQHIRERWLARAGERLVVFNYSERAKSEDSLEARLWGEYCAGRRDYVPAVILFRERRPPLIYGFYRWFDAAKRGHPEGLAAMEAHLFRELEQADSARGRSPSGEVDLP